MVPKTPDPTPQTGPPDLVFVDHVDEPLINGLVAYWEAKRAGRIAPRRADIDPAELKPHLPFLLMFDVLEDGCDFRFRLVGTGIVQGMGRDSTGKRLTELYADRPAARNTLTDGFRQVTIQKRPIFTRGRIFWVPDRLHRRFASVALPLSKDGVTVNIILAEMALAPKDVASLS
jgi:hypothetical protein